MKKSKKIVLAGILIAMTIILSRFLSIKLPMYKIGFAYIPIYLSAILLGPVYTAVVDGLADLIGALLFPFGSYFIGYTISAIVKGLIYGLVLHKIYKEDLSNKEIIIRLLIASVLTQLLVNGVLNTLWISITGGKAFFVIAGGRFLKELIMVPVHVITMFPLIKALQPAINKFLKDEEQ